VSGSPTDASSGDAAALPARGFVASGPRYSSLEELVAAGHLILTATVEDVLAAGSEGPPGEEISHLDTVVRVGEVWKGSAPGATVTVRTLELAFAGPNAKEWRQHGERVVLFLSPSTENEGLYIPAKVNYNQTIYVVTDDDLLATFPDDELAQRVAAMTLPQLRRTVRQG
jgi:hypothetical protein